MRTGLGAMIYRDRKRLVFVASLAFLAGFLFYLRSDIYITGVHFSLVAGTLYASIVGGCALLVCLFLPAMRFMIEAIAVARLVLSILLLGLPEIAPFILANPLVMALVVVGGGIGVSRLMHGRILRQSRPSAPLTARFERKPAMVRATHAQLRFLRWVDDAEPVLVRAA